MKTLFIPAKSKSKIDNSKILKISNKLPQNIALLYSIQYKTQAKEIKEIFSKKHSITKFIQILGCSNPNFPKNTQALVLIGSGEFHAISLSLETKLPIYILKHNELKEIPQKDIDLLRKKQKTAYVKFLNSIKVGVLVSTKPDQQNLQKALSLKNKLKNKSSYIFIDNNLDLNEFENFDIESWINTACPRLDLNKENNFILNLNNKEFK